MELCIQTNTKPVSNRLTVFLTKKYFDCLNLIWTIHILVDFHIFCSVIAKKPLIFHPSMNFQSSTHNVCVR